jgi:hypothetical protein
MDKEWFFGFLSGVFATIIGFVLTMIWDLWKDRRQKADRRRIVENAVGADLIVNVERIRRNLTAVREELSVLDQKMSIVAPLALLRTGFWDVAKLYPPGDTMSPDDMTKLHELMNLTEQVNEGIRSRETFRQHNGAMSNFSSQMRIRDEGLIEDLTLLEKEIFDTVGAKFPAITPQGAA